MDKQRKTRVKRGKSMEKVRKNRCKYAKGKKNGTTRTNEKKQEQIQKSRLGLEWKQGRKRKSRIEKG